MTTQTVARNAVEVIPFKAQIGAEIHCGDVRALNDATLKVVHRAFLDNLVLYINGLSLEASESLLDEVWAHAAKPEFTWHHQWQLGDVLIWDNRCAMHRRDPFDPKARRIMHRTQCKGAPIVASTAKELAHLTPHSRAA